MISCPAANGISDSSAVPITPLEPFGTYCAMASRSVIRFVIGRLCLVEEWRYSTLRYEMRQERPFDKYLIYTIIPINLV